jgi:hypothetical protein
MATGEVLQQRDESVAGHHALGIIAATGVSRHDGLLVRCVHQERVPALAAPGFADPAALEYAVAQAALRQGMADAEARPAGADHCCLERFPVDHRRFCITAGASVPEPRGR